MASKRGSRVLSALSDQCWPILPAGYDMVAEIAYRWARGEVLAPKERQAAIEAARRPTPMAPAQGSIALINVFGPISQRMSALSEISDATSCQEIQDSLKAAKAEPGCVAAILNFHTPGGSVYGLTETADLIYSYRGVFPVWGISNSMCASAGYWLASQCERLYAAPDSDTGGIGVITSHDDLTEAAMKEGRKTVYVSAPEDGFKSEDRGPMTPELRSYLQGRVDETYATFAGASARGRGLSVAKVKETFGKGRMFSAETAAAVGMVDGVRTLADMMDEMMGRSAKASRSTTAGFKSSSATKSDACETCNGSKLKPERYMGDPQGQEQCPDCQGTGKKKTASGAPAAAKKGKTMADENEGGSPPAAVDAKQFEDMLGRFAATMTKSFESSTEALNKKIGELAAENAETKRQLAESQVQAANAARIADYRSRLQTLQASGRVAAGEIDAELGVLMELKAETAEKHLARLASSAPRIPQRAAFMVTGSAGKQMPAANLIPNVKPEEEMVDTSQAALADLAAYGEICAEAGIPTDPSVPLTALQKSVLSQRLAERGVFARYLNRPN